VVHRTALSKPGYTAIEGDVLQLTAIEHGRCFDEGRWILERSWQRSG
jgi:hypothetical protein